MSAPTITAPGIDVWTGGNGTRIGYLHGDIGNPGPNPFLTRLSEHAEVVAPSLPGFDGSESRQTDTVHDWIVVLSEIVDQTGLAGCPVIASSIGATIALELAAVRPDVFSRLILIAPYGLWDDDDPGADPWAEPTEHQPAMFLAEPDRARAFYKASHLDGEARVDAEMRRYRARRTAASFVWPLPDRGLARRLHRVLAPTHLLWGAEDRIVPVSYCDRFATLLPDVVSRHLIPGAGHLAEWDRPEEVAAVVRSIMDEARV